MSDWHNVQCFVDMEKISSHIPTYKGLAVMGTYFKKTSYAFQPSISNEV